MTRPAISSALETLCAAYALRTDPQVCPICQAKAWERHDTDCPASAMPVFVFEALVGEQGRVIA